MLTDYPVHDTSLRDLLAQVAARMNAFLVSEQTGRYIQHMHRTCRNAIRICVEEEGDLRVVTVASLVHDAHRLMQGARGKYCAPSESLPIIPRLLRGLSTDRQMGLRVLHCVRHHEEYGFSAGGKTVNDLETMILQGADNLDAIGAIGIALTFY